MLAYIASWLYNLALLVAGLVVVILALLYLMQDKIIYQPDPFGNMKQNYKNPEGYRHPGERNIPYEEIQITTADNVSISTWLLKRPEASAATLIYFHGNAGNIGIRLDVFEELYVKCKFNILAVDYRGYGCSDGVPSERGFMLDADAVLKHVFSSQSLNKSAIFIYGASIGGAVAIYAAQKFKEVFFMQVRGVILENTFTCLGEVVDSVMPFLSKFRGLVLRNYWPTVDRIKHVDCSILFIAGVKDEIVPHAHMLKLYDLAKSGKKDILLVPNGDHNFVWRVAGSAFTEKISNFVKTVFSILIKDMEISLSIIPHKLTWLTAKYPPTGRVLNSDQEFSYTPLHSENGPLDLPTTIEFCKTLETMLKDGPVIHYCSVKPIEKSNGAYLMGAFLVLALKQTAQQAWENFQNLPLLFLHYRDAAPGFSSYKCSILHCLQVLCKAVQYGWVKYEEFDIGRYKNRYSPENGDITWIVPNKLAVFGCPSNEPRDNEGQRNFTPESYAAIFQQIGIKTVVRVDGYPYDNDRFIRNGIRFIDLSFRGPLPPMNIISRFLDVVESSEFSVAVHCKAGLGKSPTLAGMYVMKKFDISAEEYIAWARICRPASIIGQQQEFLKQLEVKCKMLKKKEFTNTLNYSRDSSFFRISRKNSSRNTNLELRASMKIFPKAVKVASLGRDKVGQRSHQNLSVTGGSRTQRIM